MSAMPFDMRHDCYGWFQDCWVAGVRLRSNSQTYTCTPVQNLVCASRLSHRQRAWSCRFRTDGGQLCAQPIHTCPIAAGTLRTDLQLFRTWRRKYIFASIMHDWCRAALGLQSLRFQIFLFVVQRPINFLLCVADQHTVCRAGATFVWWMHYFCHMPPCQPAPFCLRIGFVDAAVNAISNRKEPQSLCDNAKCTQLHVGF